MARALRPDLAIAVSPAARGQGRPSGGGMDPANARELILNAAERCLSRHGFSKTSIADIAQEAGCSRSNVYRFFAGREGVFEAVVVRAVARRFPEFQSVLASCAGASELLAEAMMLAIRMIREEPSMTEILNRVRYGREGLGTFSSARIREVARAWAVELAKGIPQSMLDEVREGLDPALIGEHFLMTIIQLLAGITLIGESEDPDDVRWYVMNFFIPVILGEKHVSPRGS